MLSALLRAGRSLTAGLSYLSSADSILMSYRHLFISDNRALNETTHCVRVIRPSGLAIPSLLTCVSPRSAVCPTMTPPWVV
jgi:hypothetical protein